MIRKEREMRFKTSGKNKIIKEQMREENTEVVVNVNSYKDNENKKKQAQTTVVQNDKTSEEVETKQNNEMKNFHNDQCKTCVRMRDIMGSIMPHPINAS